jgi:hypothetical protein
VINYFALFRFDGKSFLRKFKGKQIMFVGDSISRNQRQSLICLLHSAVPQAKVIQQGMDPFINYTYLVSDLFHHKSFFKISAKINNKQGIFSLFYFKL